MKEMNECKNFFNGWIAWMLVLFYAFTFWQFQSRTSPSERNDYFEFSRINYTGFNYGV